MPYVRAIAAAIGGAAGCRPRCRGGRKSVWRRCRGGVTKPEAPARRVDDTARKGCLEPSDPLLADPAQHGRGRYSHADFCEWFQTAPEFDWAACEIEGTLPEELCGVLYQVGPGNFERGGNIYKHFLDGDGYVSAWELSGGKARCCGKFVRTPDFAAEEAEGKVLFRGAFGTARAGGALANAFDIGFKNLANTNVISWGGQLLALYEAAHPSSLDPGSLDFIKYDDLGGALRPGITASSGSALVDGFLGMGADAFTAHPKMDPVARTLVGFSWTVNGCPELTPLAFDEQFQRVREQEPDEPVRLSSTDAQPHDFGLTSKWCVFFENRLDMADLPSYLLGLRGPAECLVTRPKAPQKLHLAPRCKGLPNICIEGVPNAFDVHVPHCHDGPPMGPCDAARGRRPEDLVTIYSSCWDALPEGGLFGGWGEGEEPWPIDLPPVAIAADLNFVPPTRLMRHVIDVSTRELIDRRVTPGCEDISMEHPTNNVSYTGDPRCRYIYLAACNEVHTSSPMSGWARADLKTGQVQRWWAGSRCFADEPHFVPRGGPAGTWTPGAAEGAEDDGWILGIVGDIAQGRTCLCVLDAARIDEGPVCRVWLPFVLPHGLHGSFVPAGG